jgi:transcriptional regulator with XRE-family HTH domain
MHGPLRRQLIRFIEMSDLTVYEIGKRSGVDKAQLSRFLSGKAGLTLDSLEKLAPVLGIEFTARKTPNGRS